MSIRKLAVLCSLSALALVTACGSAPRNDRSVSAPVAASYSSEYGNVRNIEVVPAAARSSGGGAVLGAVIGAALGSQVGSGTGRAAATGVGLVGGALIGDKLEQRQRNDGSVYRITVQFDSGRVGQFDYQQIDDLRVGDRVLAQGNQLHRV